MNDFQKNSVYNENNLYLKWIAITLNGKFYRRYKLDYTKGHTTGDLSAIFEYLPDDKENITSQNIIENLYKECFEKEYTNLEIPEEDENLFSFALPQDGKITIISYYASLNDIQNLDIPLISKKELNSNLWSSHLVDFSGIGDVSMLGCYSFNWFKNRAFLSFDKISAEEITALIIVLVRYHKRLYQLFTEISLYANLNYQNSVSNMYCSLNTQSDSLV